MIRMDPDEVYYAVEEALVARDPALLTQAANDIAAIRDWDTTGVFEQTMARVLVRLPQETVVFWLQHWQVAGAL
jgi:hypothetical protein